MGLRDFLDRVGEALRDEYVPKERERSSSEEEDTRTPGNNCDGERYKRDSTPTDTGYNHHAD